MMREKASTRAALVQGSREASGTKGRARLQHRGIGRGGGGEAYGMPERDEGGMKVIQKGKRFSASFVGGRKSGSLRSCLMAVAALLLLAAGLMTFAEALPVKEEDKGDVHKRSLGLEERKQIMRGVLGVMYSAEILVGGIVVCILGINGACCLCPRKDRDRLMAVLAAQRKAGAAASSAPRTSKHVLGGMALMSCLTFTMATADALQRDGGDSSADKAKISEEAQRAILQGMYGTLWSFKIVFGGIIICILGLQGACCLCPQSEQSRILAMQASARKAAAAKEMAAGGASAEEGKEL
jgi:hypothetical protein